VKAHPTTPITLYRHPLSGHSHRVELFLRLLDLPVTLIDVDLGNGEQKEPAFLAMNRCAGVDRTGRGVAGIRADGEGGGRVASGRVGALAAVLSTTRPHVCWVRGAPALA